MRIFTFIRDRWHPLHRARQWNWFQPVSKQWDPIVPARLASLRKLIYVRLFAHASLLLAQEGVEEGIRRTFTAWMTSPEGKNGLWDVGANIGIFSFSYANLHPDSSLISFEPDLRNLECLRRTMCVWNQSSHQLVPSAVSDRSGEPSFRIDRLSGATGTLVKKGNTFNELHYAAETTTETVTMVRLDDFLIRKRRRGLLRSMSKAPRWLLFGVQRSFWRKDFLQYYLKASTRARNVSVF
jgi:FkbM family methyltransferase